MFSGYVQQRSSILIFDVNIRPRLQQSTDDAYLLPIAYSLKQLLIQFVLFFFSHGWWLGVGGYFFSAHF